MRCSVLTAVVVQHVRQELVRAIDVIVDRKYVLCQWVAVKSQNDEMKQFTQLVR